MSHRLTADPTITAGNHRLRTVDRPRESPRSLNESGANVGRSDKRGG
jgi:hypothetical protein